MAKIVNYTVERGDTFQREFRFKKNGVIENITGWTIRFTLKEDLPDSADIDDSDAAVTKDITVHSNPTGGISLCELVSAAEAQDLYGKYYYDVEVTPATGPKFTLMKGTITFGGDVTRRAS